MTKSSNASFLEKELKLILNSVNPDDDSNEVQMIQLNLNKVTKNGSLKDINYIKSAIAIAKSTARNKKMEAKDEKH